MITNNITKKEQWEIELEDEDNKLVCKWFSLKKCVCSMIW